MGTERELKQTARVAGLLYLTVVILGPFVLIYVPRQLFVMGDATATATNILAHELMFRTYIVAGIFSELLFVGTVLMLFQLLKGVSRPLAIAMALLVLIDAPLSFLGSANQVATLALLNGTGFLTAFDDAQRATLATLLLIVHQKGILVSEVFWGLWLLPLAVLVYRSRFIPRLLGVWLFGNGIAYVGISLTGMLAPTKLSAVSSAATPLLFAEMALMLWLVIVGVRVRPSASLSPAIT
ncbi:MAG: DUF4386 domain-containing protein [Gemmatimonadaceae bacterium]